MKNKNPKSNRLKFKLLLKANQHSKRLIQQQKMKLRLYNNLTWQDFLGFRGNLQRSFRAVQNMKIFQPEIYRYGTGILMVLML